MNDFKRQLEKEKSEEKEAAITSLENAISIIEKSGRKPGRWELSCLVHGIQAANDGLYRLAQVEADSALTPVDKRVSDSTLSDQFDRFELPTLKQVLSEVKEVPAVLHPIFFRKK